MGNPTVFVVDDDEAVRNSLRLLLEAHRRKVRVFASAHDLLENFDSAAFDSATPGCIVLDYNMPNMNGLDLAEEINRRGLIVPAILLTALHDEQIRDRARRLGISVVLEKPLTGNELIDAIDKALAQPRSAPYAPRRG
jgi:two-component system, LuxR family, response regulator FixJ